MKKGLALMSAAGVGAGLMYLLDPDRGKRRRAHLRNKAVHLKNITADAAVKTARKARNHIRGSVAEFASLFGDKETVSNDVLEARVRSKLGHVVSCLGAVQVKAVDGRIILSGPILASEVQPLLDTVINIRGVTNIENHLEAHEQAGDIHALHGGSNRLDGSAGSLHTNE